MNDTRPTRPKHFSMLRTFVLADLVTMANAASGTGAIFLCLRYVAERDPAYALGAFALLPIALVADVLDGAVARWRRRQSPLGADLDSLADVVSFGVAPAVLAFALGMDGGWDALVLVYFVACGISRLARYNVTASALSGDDGKVKYYEGTPIPTSLGLVAILGGAFWAGAVHDQLWLGALRIGPWELHPLVLIYALSGSAMISASLRIPKP
ncbi:CDP-alcohol phosphatidyltransferase family protein [Sandaracinus amylolyticus]|uniref:CDP-diacylglycerol--serine O-phosphatidyltransferase n=1 Tax=Sandaracinus amylolyticus TaxID=927083 RepID=A0A0F6VZP5_9BACT|nr:CDP-alcohol phosphatidyltransferase family protein [Sandaracinus amylolyticus]AKF03736.1 CDP-diacylglycerol--serine O-phosphatidyltransferase [Sandaracinus amylolyticus]